MTLALEACLPDRHYQGDVAKKSAVEVARAYLVSQNLIKEK